MHRVLPLVAILCLAFAPAPFPRPSNGRDDPKPDDLKRMQGTWLSAYNIEKGVRSKAESDIRWVIAGDTLTSVSDGNIVSRCYIRLNTNTRPGAIDVRDKRDSNEFAPGRYSVTDDTLSVSIGPGTRPRDLSGRGLCNGVWIFKRKRP